MLANKSLLYYCNIYTKEKLAIFLAFIAGYKDAVGLVKWQTYVSFMSGNTTQLGIASFYDKIETISTLLIVIISFIIGIYIGTCLSLWKKCKSKTITFYIVSVLFVFYSIVSYLFYLPIHLSISFIGFTMGMMNTIVTAIGNLNVNTDFVTGTLNNLSKNIAHYTMSNYSNEKKEFKANIIYLLLLWIGFLSGAIICSFLLKVLENWVFILPATLLLICGITIPINQLKKQI